MRWTPRILLYPFSILFCILVRIKNFLYDKRILKSHSYSIPIISIGNLTVGGTGKTPMTEFLIRHLSPQYRCALLSRGYGRKTKGPLEASLESTSTTIGDEPMQMKLKFPDLKVVVAEKRVLGMDILLKANPSPEVVLLDDAFQHRAIKPGLSMLIVDYFRPINQDWCLPAGNLREPRKGIKRAKIVIINKCPPNLPWEEALKISKSMALPSSLKLFFSSIVYCQPKPLSTMGKQQARIDSTWEANLSIIAVAGIGNPNPFFKEARRRGNVLKTIAYPDHHNFSDKDIKKLNLMLEQSGPETIILTTEKDAVRLLQKDLDFAISNKIWYVPIKLTILFNQQDPFLKTINNYVKGNKRNSKFS
ncbi:tetraacyldisaccharide 4'-kinase [Thermophagus sp. OGC60D27]|uniref:tetraacyldisaccharide 4'-kinase n=1 Tax=Thermophagus sp. OGC60D27 TaxID=3458415 RepID=UPI004038297A